jgi:hypothetical protein
MATGDGSPTSGGSGDVLVTEDTFTDTGTGTSGQKLAAGKLYTGAQGTSLGPVVAVRNDLPTNDQRSQQLLGYIAELLEQIRDDTDQGTVVSQSTAAQIAIQANVTSVTAVIGKATSVQLLGPNVARIGATFYNDSTSTGNLYLLCVQSNGNVVAKASAAAGGCTVRIPPGGYYELLPSAVHLGAIVGLWDSVTVPGWVNITEYS